MSEGDFKCLNRIYDCSGVLDVFFAFNYISVKGRNYFMLVQNMVYDILRFKDEFSKLFRQLSFLGMGGAVSKKCLRNTDLGRSEKKPIVSNG